MSNRLEMTRVSIAYDGQMAVMNVALQLPLGHIGCLTGPSGVGKTSLLRAIAGFERLAHGAIHIDGARVCSRKSHIPPDLRGVGMVFRGYALFPHLTVRQNLAFGLPRLGSADADKRLAEVLRQVGLHSVRGVEGRYPHQLTGEQSLRVALGRALAPNPRLLLMDEPFDTLDQDARERLPLEIRDILKGIGMTALIATHDQDEAFAMADEIGVMTGGRLLQWADAETLYHRPANRFVASFIGKGSILQVWLVPGVGIKSEIGDLPLPDGGVSLIDRPYLEIMVRPQQVTVRPLQSPNDKSGNAELVRKIYQGMETFYALRLASGTEILALAPPDSGFRVGEKVHAELKPHNPAILYLGD